MDKIDALTKALSGVINSYRSKVRRKTKIAIEKGEVRKKALCEACGTKKATHIHHKCYSNKYDIIWLCNSCHISLHHRLKNSFLLESGPNGERHNEAILYFNEAVNG